MRVPRPSSGIAGEQGRCVQAHASILTGLRGATISTARSHSR